MDWTHIAAFCFGFVAFILVAIASIRGRKPKGEVHTRRDFMASSALRAIVSLPNHGSRKEAAAEAVAYADALLAELDRKESQ